MTPSEYGISQVLSASRPCGAQTGHRLHRWSGSTATRLLRDMQIGLALALEEGLSHSAQKQQKGRYAWFFTPSLKQHLTAPQKFVWVEAVTTFPFNVNDPVEAQAYDSVNSKVALASHSGVIKVFKLRRKSLILLWEINDQSDIPRSLQFFGSGKRYLLSSMLESGEIICRNGDDSTVEWKRLLLGGIGNAVLSPDGSALLVDNLNTNDFDLFRFPTGSLHTSISSKSLERIVKGVAFVEGGKFIACGSNQRFIQVIDLATHRLYQELVSENPSDIFQTLAAVSLGDHRHLIACGSSSNRPAIYVWEKVDYGFEDRPTPSSTLAVQTPDRALQNRYTKLFDTFLVSAFNFLLILLWSTHTVWLPHLLKCIDGAGVHVFDTSEVLTNDNPLNAPSLVLPPLASTSSATEAFSNALQSLPTLTIRRIE
ncbi:hypothetical protein C0992_009511 [Termitomyces sp. T32_za158]|nr:hypothetical protein C0992_009511 [Termitomyces sp. T32_za158]